MSKEARRWSRRFTLGRRLTVNKGRTSPPMPLRRVNWGGSGQGCVLLEEGGVDSLFLMPEKNRGFEILQSPPQAKFLHRFQGPCESFWMGGVAPAADLSRRNPGSFSTALPQTQRNGFLPLAYWGVRFGFLDFFGVFSRFFRFVYFLFF